VTPKRTWTGLRSLSTRGTPQAVGLLKKLGVSCKLTGWRANGRPGRFWNRNIDHLGVLYEARRCYRDKMRSAHPDAGGSVLAAQALNDIWHRVERIFRKRGYEL